jgi:hypothetical protein
MSENLAGLTDEIQEILHEEKEEKLVCLSDILIRVVLMGRCDKRIWS